MCHAMCAIGREESLTAGRKNEQFEQFRQLIETEFSTAGVRSCTRCTAGKSSRPSQGAVYGGRCQSLDLDLSVLVVCKLIRFD